jgi:COP9 signalosome complex subunit 1
MQIHGKLTEACKSTNAPLPTFNAAWFETTTKKALAKYEKLDNDLKSYKANSIKESIRRGHDEMGDHCVDVGDLRTAVKCYSRARDYCTTNRHVVSMCLNVIKVS